MIKNPWRKALGIWLWIASILLVSDVISVELAIGQVLIALGGIVLMISELESVE